MGPPQAALAGPAAGERQQGAPAAGLQDASTEHFLMHGYKVIPCSKRYRHDWSVCPFAHTGEMAARRDPKLYLPIFCYHSKQRLPCPRGEQCPHAHNLFEYWLHPARYRTELCQFGMGCTRPVCFFAHNEAQLRHTGVPGGPQPVVAPPEPLVGGAAGGPAAAALSQEQQLLLSGINAEAAAASLSGPALVGAPHAAVGAGASLQEHAISDVLPVLGGGGGASARRGRGAGAVFGAHAPPGGLKSTPLPRLDWMGGPAAAGTPPPTADGPVLLAAPGGGQALAYPQAAGGPGADAAALALAQLQADAAHSQQLRRTMTDVAAFAAAAAAASSAPGAAAAAGAPLQHSQTLDMQALVAAASAAMAGPTLLASPQQAGAGVGAGAASPQAQQHQQLLDLQAQLAAMQLAAGGGAPGGFAPQLGAGGLASLASHSAPLPLLGGGAGAGAGAPLLAEGSDVAALAAALQQQQAAAPRRPRAQRQQLDAVTAAPPPAAGYSGPASPAGSPLSAPLANFTFQRAPGSSRSGSPPSFASGGAAGAGSSGGGGAGALLVVGDEGLSLDKLQEQLSDAPPRAAGRRGAAVAPGRDAGGSGARSPAPGAAAPAKGAAGGGGMGREAAAALLAQMPESAVQDLLRVIAAGQAVLSQPTA